MIRVTAIAASIVFLALAGCRTKSSNNRNSNKTTTAGIPVLPELNSGSNTRTGQSNSSGSTMSSAPANAGQVALNPAHGQPGHRCDIAVGAPLGSTPATAAASTLATSNESILPAAKSGLNPAHGQPGHRCDIAVGAPLSSAPATAAASTSATSNKSILPAAKSGLNPAHGQPGHRCDIAVGAPLDSKPASTTKNAAAGTATNISSALNTVVSDNKTVLPSTKTGLNPAHGQPGHRCDIAVGAPLDSKPSANTINATAGAKTNVQSPLTPMQVTPILPAKDAKAFTGTKQLAEPVKTGGRVNPAHGKPGHRCDIAVGAQLPSDSASVKQ